MESGDVSASEVSASDVSTCQHPVSISEEPLSTCGVSSKHKRAEKTHFPGFNLKAWNAHRGYIPLDSPQSSKQSVINSDSDESSSHGVNTDLPGTEFKLNDDLCSCNDSATSQMFIQSNSPSESHREDANVIDQNSYSAGKTDTSVSQLSSDVSQISLSPAEAPAVTYPQTNLSKNSDPLAPTVAAPTPTVPSSDTSPGDLIKKYTTDFGCLSSLPNQRKRIAHRNGVSFTLMVAGESGSGKSTFVQMLLGDFDRTPRQVSNGRHHVDLRSGPVVPKPSSLHRTTEIEIHQCTAEENHFVAQFTIVDTPGFGDFTNNMYAWVPITNYIDLQYQRYMCGEEQPHRGKLRDNRVHVCLYFLQPSGHELLPLDVTTMKEIGKRVNLVPVISKSDSQTVEEIAEFKKLVRKCVKEHDIPVFTVENEDRDWPYALVSSTSMVRALDGRQVYGRQYDWGIVEVDNPAHSDLPKLKELLMGSHMLALIDSTHETHYKKLRTELRLRRLSKALGTGVNGNKSPRYVVANASRASPHGSPPESILKSPTPAGRKSISEEQTIGEIAHNMTGLEILTAVSPFGYHFLEEQLAQQDLLYKQRVLAIRNQFSVVLNFQLQRFEQEARELEFKKQQFETELSELQTGNDLLAEHISELEARVSRRKK